MAQASEPRLLIAGRADKVCVMNAGKIVETTDTTTLFDNPRHPYTEALFGSLPETGADKGQRLYSIPGMPPDLTQTLTGCRFAPRCRHAQDKCRDSEPPLSGETGLRRYACFFPVGAEEKRAGDRVVPVAEIRESDGEPLPQTQVGEPILKLSNLVKDFTITAGAVLQRKVGKVSAVADISLSIRAGETFGLVGESGCGKTTIGRLVVGWRRPPRAPSSSPAKNSPSCRNGSCAAGAGNLRPGRAAAARVRPGRSPRCLPLPAARARGRRVVVAG